MGTKQKGRRIGPSESRNREELIRQFVEWGGDDGFLAWLEEHDTPACLTEKTGRGADQRLTMITRLRTAEAVARRVSADPKRKAELDAYGRALDADYARIEARSWIEATFERLKRVPTTNTPYELHSYFWRGALVPYTAYSTGKPRWAWIDSWLGLKGLRPGKRTQVWWQNVARRWKPHEISRPGPAALGRAAHAFLYYGRKTSFKRILDGWERHRRRVLARLHRPWSKQDRAYLRFVAANLSFCRHSAKTRRYADLPKELWFDSGLQIEIRPYPLSGRTSDTQA